MPSLWPPALPQPHQWTSPGGTARVLAAPHTAHSALLCGEATVSLTLVRSQGNLGGVGLRRQMRGPQEASPTLATAHGCLASSPTALRGRWCSPRVTPHHPGVWLPVDERLPGKSVPYGGRDLLQPLHQDTARNTSGMKMGVVCIFVALSFMKSCTPFERCSHRWMALFSTVRSTRGRRRKSTSVQVSSRPGPALR